MQAGVKSLNSGAVLDRVFMCNVDTMLYDYVSKDKIKKFWDNLSDEDIAEMASWTYQQFLERINKACCYYLKRNGKIIAIGGTYPDDARICLWLLVTRQASKYPLSLIKAVRKGIKKDLGIYPKNVFHNVIAMPNRLSINHCSFLEKVLDMAHLGVMDTYALYGTSQKELFECVSQ